MILIAVVIESESKLLGVAYSGLSFDIHIFEDMVKEPLPRKMYACACMHITLHVCIHVYIDMYDFQGLMATHGFQLKSLWSNFFCYKSLKNESHQQIIDVIHIEQ